MYTLISNRSFRVLILVIFCLLLFIPSTLNRDLHYRDELRYVEVTREMGMTNQWMVPHFGGEFYSDKPPVYFWVLGLSHFIFGEYSTFAMVLPSIISSIIIVLMISNFGSFIFGRRYFLLSGLVLATSLLYFGLSIFVRMDLLMIVFITAAFISFYKGYVSDKDLKEKHYLFMFFWVGLATIVKGPAGLLDPLTGIALFLLLERNWAEVKNMRLIKGFSIFLGVVLAWIIPAVIAGGPDYAYQLLVVQTIGRTVNSFAHQQPFYYYFTTFPAAFFPWSIFLLSSFVYIIKYRTNMGPEVKYLLAWFWAPFIVFSLVSGKLDIYLLPIYPAAALLVVFLLKEIYENRKHYIYISIPAVILFLLFILFAIFIPDTADGVAVRLLLLPTIIAFVVFPLLGFVLLFKRKYSYISYLITFMVFCLIFNFSLSLVPPLSQGYTKRPIANKMIELKQEDSISNIVAYKYEQPESLAVYTDFMIHDIGSREKLLDYLNRHKNTVVLMDETSWGEIKEKVSPDYKEGYSSNGYLLIYRE